MSRVSGSLLDERDALVAEVEVLRKYIAESDDLIDRLMTRRGNAGCADGHIPIRWNPRDESEPCPVCSLVDALEAAMSTCEDYDAYKQAKSALARAEASN